MNENELLKAIGEMIDQKLEPLQKGQEALQQDVTKIKITLENEIDRKLSALFEGHQLETEKAGTVEEKMDDIESSLLALEVVTRNNIKEINKLKAKIG
jgi:hypothetical protein